MKLYCNGVLYDHSTPLFGAGNRGFRYGDGLFETIKVIQGRVLFWAYHMERLRQGMQVLQIGGTLPAAVLHRQVLELCGLNDCTAAARVRLAVYRNDEGQAGYVLEAALLDEAAFQFNEQGWVLTAYPQVHKAADMLANLKTANYLPYIMAAQHAAACGADECLVYNSGGHICDGSRTNIFIWRNEVLLTPGLDQGCVAGVMRRYLLEYCAGQGVPVVEQPLTEADLLAADEVTLTNAIQGMRWVSSYGNRTYSNERSKALFHSALATIYG